MKTEDAAHIAAATALFAFHQLRTVEGSSVTSRIPIPKRATPQALRAYITKCVNAVHIAADTRHREQHASLALPGLGASSRDLSEVSEERAVLEVREAMRMQLTEARKTSKGLARDATALQVRRMLPSGKVLDTVTRYEAHLDRLLTRTIHELQRIQALRAGNGAAVPRALDVDVRGVQGTLLFIQ